VISKIISEATTPEADIRCWESLPLYTSFAALELAPGQYSATVEFLDSGNRVVANLTKTIGFAVPATGDKVVYISDQSSTPQTQ
jgi:hypothetical protein